MARVLKKDSSHKDATEKFIIEDLSVMSDFDIHKTCLAYRVINPPYLIHLQYSTELYLLVHRKLQIGQQPDL